jgi:hypothetical protein
MDILSVKSGLIVHQVNCQGVFGAGLALQIRYKYPEVFRAYRQFNWYPGMVQFVQAAPDLVICNLAGQLGTGGNATLIEAHEKAWPKVTEWVLDNCSGDYIYAPWKIGCGLGGGDWSIIQPLVESLCPVTWVDLDKDKPIETNTWYRTGVYEQNMETTLHKVKEI